MPQTHTVRLAQPRPHNPFLRLGPCLRSRPLWHSKASYDSIELREVGGQPLPEVSSLSKRSVSAVTVITAEELKSSGVDTVLEALRRRAWP